MNPLYFEINHTTEMSLFQQGDEQFIANAFYGYRPTPLVPSRTKSEWKEHDKSERNAFQVNLKKVYSGELKVFDGLKLGMCPHTWCHAMIYFEEDNTK